MLYTLAPIPFFAFAPALIPDQTLATQAPVPFLSEIVQQVAPDDFILADGNMVSAVSWSLKRDDIYLFRNSGELAYGLSRPGGQGRYFDIEAAARLIGQHPGHVLILAKGDHYQQWADKLPHPASLQQNILHGFVALRY